MPELSFKVGEVAAMEYAAVPTVVARLHIANSTGEVIQSVLLNCQLQLRPINRRYSSEEQLRLLDIFGEREQWGRSMKPLHWTNLVVKVPPFQGGTVVDLELPCSLEFDVAANKYFYGLREGKIPVAVMFSGTVFFLGESGSLQIAQIPWDREARFELPVEIWKTAIDAHYPESAWLRLPRETFERLYEFKVGRGIPMWQEVVETLLHASEQAAAVQEEAPSAGGRS